MVPFILGQAHTVEWLSKSTSNRALTSFYCNLNLTAQKIRCNGSGGCTLSRIFIIITLVGRGVERMIARAGRFCGKSIMYISQYSRMFSPATWSKLSVKVTFVIFVKWNDRYELDKLFAGRHFVETAKTHFAIQMYVNVNALRENANIKASGQAAK